jgi:hypothetical protein
MRNTSFDNPVSRSTALMFSGKVEDSMPASS